MKKILVTLLLSILPAFIFGGRLGAPSEELSLTILNPHSGPQAGQEWVVNFKTAGRADLTITLIDQATIDDLDFVSLTCDGEERTPQILDGDVIFYPDWSCEETGEIIHLVNVARPHTLKFQFGSQEEYAYNHPGYIQNPSFEDGGTGWTETGTSGSGGTATDWKTDGSYSYKLYVSGGAGNYRRITQTVDFTYLGKIIVDLRVYATSNSWRPHFTVSIDTDNVWLDSGYPGGSPHDKLNQEIDVSSYTGNHDLIFEVYDYGYADGHFWIDNIREKLSNGRPCSSNDECTSGYCVDGYCCNSACTDAGYGCDVPGSEGTCTAYPNQAPTCSLVASLDSGTAPLSVTLDGSGSSDPDGTIVTYEWDWTDDGSYDYSESPGDGKADHTYDAGNHTARLRVTDDDGATSTCTDSISVSAPPAYQPDKTMCDDSSGSGGGVVSASTISSPDTAAARSEKLWVVTGYNNIDFPSYSELQTMYDYANAAPVPNDNPADVTTSGTYKMEDCTITSSPCASGVSAVIFVDGDLAINADFGATVSGDPLNFRDGCNSSLAFIVRGDINIAGGVNNIYGIFYSGGDMGMNAVLSNIPLYVFGSLLAHDFDLNRSLGADNADYPAEQIIFMPKYFITLKDVLGRSQYTWKEVKSP